MPSMWPVSKHIVSKLTFCLSYDINLYGPSIHKHTQTYINTTLNFYCKKRLSIPFSIYISSLSHSLSSLFLFLFLTKS